MFPYHLCDIPCPAKPLFSLSLVPQTHAACLKYPKYVLCELHFLHIYSQAKSQLANLTQAKYRLLADTLVGHLLTSFAPLPRSLRGLFVITCALALSNQTGMWGLC